MDIYLFSTIANIIWQIFTILFVLYRFTSFFSIIYNFTKFLGKIFKGIIYIKEKISSYFVQRNLQNQDLSTTPRTIIQSIYDYLFKKSQTSVQLPLYETTTSFINEFDFNIESNFECIIDDKSDSSGFYIDRNNTEEDSSYIGSSITQNPFSAEDSNMLLNSNFIMNNIK